MLRFNMINFLFSLALFLAAISVSNVEANILHRAASSGCPTTGPLSCHNATVQSDLCCFESPGVCIMFLIVYGHLFSGYPKFLFLVKGFDTADTGGNYCSFNLRNLLKIVYFEFWDTDPSTGPSDSWTIHGISLCIYFKLILMIN